MKWMLGKSFGLRRSTADTTSNVRVKQDKSCKTSFNTAMATHDESMIVDTKSLTSEITIDVLSDWLQLDKCEEVSLREKDERMPAIFKDVRNIDRLCNKCQTVPWTVIRTKAEETMHRVLENPPPTVQTQFATGHYERSFYKHEWNSLLSIANGACQGCHFCAMVIRTGFSRRVGIAGYHGSRRCIRSTCICQGFSRDGFIRRFFPDEWEASSLKHCEMDRKLVMKFAVIRRSFGEPIVVEMSVDLSHRATSTLLLAIDSNSARYTSPQLRHYPSTSSMCKYWLEYCSETHAECAREDHRPSRMPKRVVFLEERNSTLHARLCVPNRNKARYAALSHRWSSSRSVMLTKSNSSNLMQCIDMKDLSRTFLEAFHLTFSLGMRYVWIDSLCILQDDAEEWAEQSADMGNIYSSAYVTICAHASDDGTSRCISLLQPDLMDTSCQVIEGVFFTPETPGCCDEPVNTAKTRAWIMQEEILSRRKLYCGVSGMSWKCRQMSSTDKQPWAHAVDVTSSYRESIGQGLLPSDGGTNSSFFQWKALIGDYTKRELSFVQDKLPALSALSCSFGQSMSWLATDFLAGLWRQHLPEALLWKRGSEDTMNNEVYASRLLERSKTSRIQNAPTWTWASYDGPISFYQPYHSHCVPQSFYVDEFPALQKCKVLGNEIKIKTSNLYGQVLSGSITLEALALVNPQDVNANIGPIHTLGTFAWSNLVHWDGEVCRPQDCIVLQVNPEAGLILTKVAGCGADQEYQRVGICLAEQGDPLFRTLKGGRWETRTVTIV